MTIGRAYATGSLIGIGVFLQGVLVFRLPVLVPWLQMWALACGGVFGLTLQSTFADSAQATASLTFAAIGLTLFYGTAALVLNLSYRRFKYVGVVVVTLLLLLIHVAMYLAVIRAVVA